MASSIGPLPREVARHDLKWGRRGRRRRKGQLCIGFFMIMTWLNEIIYTSSYDDHRRKHGVRFWILGSAPHACVTLA